MATSTKTGTPGRASLFFSGERPRAGGYTATQAGAALLPLPLVIALASPAAGALAARVGPRWLLITGPVIVAAGFLLAVRIGSDTSYWLGVFPAMVMIALGMAGAVAPLTTAVLMRRRRFPNASLADDRNESLRAKARWGARALC